MRKLLLVPVAVLLVACTPSPGDAPAPGQDPLAAAVRKANADYARMRARDPDLAESLMRSHVRRAARNLFDHLDGENLPDI